MDTTEHVRNLVEQGFTVIEHSHDAEDVEAFRAAIGRIHARHGAPQPYADPARELAAEVMINPTGFVVFKLLAVAPELAPRLLSRPVVEVTRALLGSDMHIELTGASVSDASRPFFTWHNHIGGIDVEAYRQRREYPRFSRSQRVIVVTYLDDIDADGGELLVLPRKITDPTEPPEDQSAQSWPGQVRLSFPRGSTLILEQCTWHAVHPRNRGGLRMFIGCYFTSSKAPATRIVDDSLRGFTGGGPLLQSVLPRR